MKSRRARKNVRRSRMRRGRREEGAVMLVVLLILMLATASSAISMGTVQSELRASGDDRIALQAHYLAETAIMTTLTWIDVLGQSGQWFDVWNTWAIGGARPEMVTSYGEPQFPAGMTGQASRTTMVQQRLLITDATQNEIAPVDSGDILTFGSFGPNQAYGQVGDGYIVDITDCQVAGSSAVPGAPVGGGPGSLRVMRFSCVLTARARMALAEDRVADEAALAALDATERTRRWTVQAQTYRQLAFVRSHDARATILTPEMLVAAE